MLTIIPNLIIVCTIVITSYVIGSSLIWKFSSPKNRRKYRICCIVFSILLSIIIPFVYFLQKEITKSYIDHGESLRREAKRRDADFWTKFSKIEPKLYSAKTDSDPSVNEMQALLTSYGSAYRFKLGPKHDAKRELGIAWYSYSHGSHLNSPAVLIDALPKSLKNRWYVGIGFAKPNHKQPLYLIKQGQEKEASAADFSFHTTRVNRRVDINLYTDYPVAPLQDTSPLAQAEAYITECIGEEAFHRYVGKIQLHQRGSPFIDENQYTNLRQAFMARLTPQERHDLDSIVTSQPCVGWIPTGEYNEFDDALITPSPYIELRPSAIKR